MLWTCSVEISSITVIFSAWHGDWHESVCGFKLDTVYLWLWCHSLWAWPCRYVIPPFTVLTHLTYWHSHRHHHILQLFFDNCWFAHKLLSSGIQLQHSALTVSPYTLPFYSLLCACVTFQVDAIACADNLFIINYCHVGSTYVGAFFVMVLEAKLLKLHVLLKYAYKIYHLFLLQTFVKGYLISFVRLLLGIDAEEGSGHLSSVGVILLILW